MLTSSTVIILSVSKLHTLGNRSQESITHIIKQKFSEMKCKENLLRIKQARFGVKFACLVCFN